MRSAHSPRFGSSRAWPSSFADLRRLRHGSRPLGATKGDAHPTESAPPDRRRPRAFLDQDRKSTRLSSHQIISYAVFCLKKKNEFALRIEKTMRSISMHV